MNRSVLRTNQSKLARVDEEFIHKLRKVYPNSKSDRESTNNLNTILDEMLWGRERNVKKKIRK